MLWCGTSGKVPRTPKWTTNSEGEKRLRRSRRGRLVGFLSRALRAAAGGAVEVQVEEPLDPPGPVGRAGRPRPRLDAGTPVGVLRHPPRRLLGVDPPVERPGAPVHQHADVELDTATHDDPADDPLGPAHVGPPTSTSAPTSTPAPSTSAPAAPSAETASPSS